MFTGCQVCFYKNTRLNNCSYVPCKEKQNVKLLCIQRDQENELDPSSQTIEKSEDALHMILPVAIAVSALAVIFALISKYVCHRHLKKQTSLQKPKSRKEHSECSTRSSNVTRITNHSYNTIELQEQGNRSSIPEDKLESPFMEAKEEIYNHLRDKQLSNDEDDNKCNYDTTKNVIAQREQCHESSKGIYDRLWDARRGTNSDETYHHAFSIISKSSVNEDTEKRKHVFDSPNTSNHILKSVPDVSYDEQDRSNLCEKHPEDHTYFILEQI
ncbi:uncharacterized protein LOC134231436 isoform X2 [Saccostrea cucullata]|uniref:uncharacterized protein LOC134231436 isoform X2 n=1 Tax=Saccostrea cuccullata TaxID=36930 RepID=UPI002ED13B10